MTSCVVAAPVAARPALASLAAHAVPGVEEVDVVAGTVRRLVDLGQGPSPVLVTLRDGVDGGVVGVVAVPEHAATATTSTWRAATDTPGPTSADPARAHPTGRTTDPLAPPLRRLLLRWFGLEDDLDEVRAALGTDPVLGAALRERPSLRVLGHPDGFEAAVTTVLGQQVSLAAARTFSGRLAAALGAPHPSGLRAFPAPEAVAAVDPSALQSLLRVPHARARTVHAVSLACADGLRLAPDTDHEDVRRRLLALPGVGPWTVEYLAIRVLGDRDALPSGDLVLRRALGGVDARALHAAARAWRPWRAYAAFHLWTRTAYPG